MKILLVHGVGYQEDKQFETVWQPIIQGRLPGKAITFSSLAYDADFKSRSINWWKLGPTALALLKSWAEHAGDTRALEERGLLTPAEATFGMAIKWAEFDDLRATLRDRLKLQMQNDPPDVVVAHSLGTLICYDLFARPENSALVDGKILLTCGAQIAHPALCNLFDGRIAVPEKLGHWYAQFNPHDRVFAWEPVDLPGPNFTRIDTPFYKDFINHDAACYLSRDEAAPSWDAIGSKSSGPTAMVRSLAGTVGMTVARRTSSVKKALADRREPNARALLIGINEYASPQLKLDGCINDAYLMSALLQEKGFSADDIRMVVNDRATTEGIQQRIQWLLADAQPGDTRILYFSGHGVQMPSYGSQDKPDHMIEALVPYDFDWTEGRTIADKWLAKQYGNLPYDLHFAAVFDCCHAGGLTRGAALKVRSIAPPDDIAHRQLKWDPEWEMWVPRDFIKKGKRKRQSYDPASPVQSLGRALDRRPAHMRGLGKAFGHMGPYMPAIITACRASELAHEYRHGGGHSYGAFTYALSQVLRDKKRKKIHTARQLRDEINGRLPDLGYDQHCNVDGPGAQLDVVGRWIEGN